MRYHGLIILAATALMSGCLTTDEKEVRPLTPVEVDQFAHTFKDPRYFYGLELYDKPNGNVGVSGGFQLHMTQRANLPIEESHVSFLPLVKVKGRTSIELALLDIASPECWTDYGTYQKFWMKTVGYQGSFPYEGIRDTGSISAYLSVCELLRLDRLSIENLLFYTRLESGSLGPIARGHDDVNVVLGWSMARHFEQIRYDFEQGRIQFAVTDAYRPFPGWLQGTAEIQRVPGYGCVVMGSVAGKPQPFVLDPAGDFDLVWPGQAGKLAQQVTLGDLSLGDFTVATDTVDGKLPHIGGRLLSKYTLVLCPLKKRVYFEQPQVAEK